MLMKSFSLFSFCILLCFSTAFAQSEKVYHVKSPDGKINLTVSVDKNIKWSVNHEQTEVITPSEISMTVEKGGDFGKNAVVKSAKNTSVNQEIHTPIYKKDNVRDRFNQLVLTFKGDYGLAFRAYNDGVA